MIRDARTFLYLSIFYIEYDAYGKTLLAALLEAQRRGVAVNLLIDGFGQRLGGVLMSAAQRSELRREQSALRAAGGVVTFYRPSRLSHHCFRIATKPFAMPPPKQSAGSGISTMSKPTN